MTPNALTKGAACGVMIGNCSAFAVAAFAIWKAGKALVLIDPNWPDRRIAQVVSSVGLECTLTVADHRSRAEAILGADRVLTVDVDELARAAPPAAKDEAAGTTDPHSTAYVIFTSGSTGPPKGVPITHANLAQLLAWQEDAFDLSARYRSLQVLPVSFDFGFEEVLNQLCFGGSVVFAETADQLDSAHFAAKARAVEADMLYITPAQLDHFLPELDLSPFRMILVGGETFPWALWEKLVPYLDGERRIFNGYGPTETTITATVHRLSRDDKARYDAARSVPIGVPSAQCRVEILDEGGQPCPPGVPGKIVVGGGGVSPGYIGAAPGQAARFVPDPIEPSARVFHTGDLARRHEDGAIEFLGRDDGQIKVGGVRVELEEIAYVLRKAGATQVVVDHDSQRTGKQLVAYVVVAADAPLRALYAAAADALPVHARPQIVQIAQIPQTVNGKTDLVALRSLAPALDQSTPEAEADGLTSAITQVWQELLGTRELGPEDDVFDFGATSLLLVQARAALEDQAGIVLSLPDLFGYRSPRAQAALYGGDAVADPEVHRAAGRDPRGSFAKMRQRRHNATKGGHDGE